VNGQLVLRCAQRDGCSRLLTSRFYGVARASRALREPDRALRVVTSTLGPGILAGDRLMREVEVGAGARLVVAAQMATPVFAGTAPSRGDAWARVAAGAALFAPGDVLLLAAGAAHESSARLDVSGDGFALHAEIVVLGAGARLRSRTLARIDGRLAVRDACDLDGDGSERALLTAIALSADDERQASLATAFGELFAREPADPARTGRRRVAAAAPARAHRCRRANARSRAAKSAASPPAGMKRYALAAIPVVMLTLAIPAVNRVEPRIFGLPFLLAWIVAWILLTPAFLALVAHLDRAR